MSKRPPRWPLRTAGPFRCPECGHDAFDHIQYLGSIPDGIDPWSRVLQAQRCISCRTWIPRHLGERWGGITEEEAERKWREVYRERRRVDPGE